MSAMNGRQLISRLRRLGFEQRGQGLAQGDVTAHLGDRWLSLRTAEEMPNDGSAGLWKRVDCAGDDPHCVFELPLSVVAGPEIHHQESSEHLDALQELVTWAVATRAGTQPAGWACPPAAEFEGLLPGGWLTLETGRFARQASVVCGDDNLSVSMPLLHRLPAELSPGRRACLKKLLADVQSRCRLTRFREVEASEEMKAGEEVKSIQAEVSLTGAPRFAIPRLLRIGLEAVRHAVSQSVAAVELLVDPAVNSGVWDSSVGDSSVWNLPTGDVPSMQDCPAEGSQK